MKVSFLLIALQILLTAVTAHSETALKPDKRDVSGQKYILKTVQRNKTIQKNVYLVGTGGTNLNRVVYIFHGYKPAGDAYKQSPVYFINNWNLDLLSEKYGILFVLPDNGEGVFLIAELNNPLSDMSMMNALKKEIDKRYFAVKSPLVIGFSDGVEGAVKFAVLNNIPEIMAISGNYLHDHKKGLQTKDSGYIEDVFERESPVKLLEKESKIIYLFSEEKNPANARQAKILVDASLPGIILFDLRFFGIGYGHDWNFLTSPGITGSLEKIIAGDIENLTGPDGSVESAFIP